MITKNALPPPDFIQSALTEMRKQKTLEELKHLGSPNRIRVWTDDASSMTVNNLVRIAEYAEELDLETIRYWKEILFCSDWPVVTIQQEWHDPHTEYVCMRLMDISPGAMILHAGELCELLGENDRGKLQARSRFNDAIYELDTPPTYIVIGRLAPLENKE